MNFDTWLSHTVEVLNRTKEESEKYAIRLEASIGAT